MDFQPTPQQVAIADAVRAGGHVVVQARAGTGKTTTLMMLVDAVPAGRTIFLGAFNKAIARELEKRLQDRGVDWRRAKASTLHSAGYSAWRKAHPAAKVDEAKVFKIIDAKFPNVLDEDRGALRKLASLAKQAGFGALTPIGSTDAWFDLVDHFAIESEWSDFTTLDDMIEMAKEVLTVSLQADDQHLDFDDMLLAPLAHNLRLFQYDVVMVDEAQDTNSVRRALALKMVRRGGQLVAVGDDRQAIYGFSGADSDALQLIDQAIGGATWLPLSRTFRCGKAIVEVARRIVPDYEADEANHEGVVGATVGLDRLIEANLGPDDGILCRLNAPLISLAYALISRGVGCRIEGRDIAKGLVALCRRWRVARASDLVRPLEAYVAREEQRWQAKGSPEKAQPLIDRVDALLIVIDRVVDRAPEATPKDVADELLAMFGDSDDDGRRVVTLSSVHKAKGLEWDRVFILDPGKDPKSWARKEWQLNQEYNLDYVAVTRARHVLNYLTAR